MLKSNYYLLLNIAILRFSTKEINKFYHKIKIFFNKIQR